MANSPVDAERDLGSLVSTYPRSKRYDDALLRLARLEMGRGDRANAVQHLALLAQHAPAGPAHTRAIVLGAVAQLDGGDTTAACQTLPAALDSVASADVILAEEFRTASAACASRATTVAGPVVDSPAHAIAMRDSAAAAPKRSTNDTAKHRRAKVAPATQLPVIPPPSITLPTTPPPSSNP
jgi:hypothetical protein